MSKWIGPAFDAEHVKVRLEQGCICMLCQIDIASPHVVQVDSSMKAQVKIWCKAHIYCSNVQRNRNADVGLQDVLINISQHTNKLSVE